MIQQMQSDEDANAFPFAAVRFAPEPLTTDQRLELWERMLTIRIHEEIVEGLNAEGLLRGSTHLYIGMEAGAVGVISATGPNDCAIGYYRGHGHALAMGVPARSILAEILGREGGSCGGRGGTKHVTDISRNYYGSYAVVGQQVPIAVGLAWSSKLRHEPSIASPIVVCFFGDGAANQGASLEAFNLAAAYSLPCLFVCENNGYAVSTPVGRVTGHDSFVERAKGFGIEGIRVDGMDVDAVRAGAIEARAAMASTGRPYFLELETYRFKGHSVFQLEDAYRDTAEVARWRERDPVVSYRASLERLGVPAARFDSIRQRVKQEIEGATEWARQSPILASVDVADMFAGVPAASVAHP